MENFQKLKFSGGVPILEFDILRILIVLPAFFYASFKDIRERRVPDTLWIVTSAAGILIYFLELREEGNSQFFLMLCFVSTFFLLYLILMEFLENGDLRFESAGTFFTLLSLTVLFHFAHLSVSPSLIRFLTLLPILPAFLIFKSRKFLKVSLISLFILLLFNLNEMRANEELFFFASSFISIFIFTFILSYLDIFGWADAKAFWTIAIVFPHYPEFSEISRLPSPLLIAPELTIRILLMMILFSSVLYLISRILKRDTFFILPLLFASFFISFGSFPMTVFTNSIFFNLIALVIPFFFFLRNLIKGERAPKRMMLLYAFPMEIERLLEEERSRRGYSRFKLLEMISEGRLISSYRGFDYNEKDLIELQKRKEKVWVTYGIPFILPVTLGLIFAILRGDLLIEILRRV